MDRFHIDGAGNVRRCTDPACPEPFHSGDPAACRARYEKLMTKYTVPTPWTKTRRPR